MNVGSAFKIWKNNLPHLTWTFLKRDSRCVFSRCCLRGRNCNEEYVRAAGSPYAVAENWNGDPNGQLGQQRFVGWDMWNKGKYNWNILKLETQETQKNPFPRSLLGGNMELPNDLGDLVSSHRFHTFL